VTTFTVAVNRKYLSQAGEKKEEVSFLRVVVWARRAEICNEYLRKGSPVFVEGRLQTRSWDAPDGTKRSAVEVVANNVQFLGRAEKAPGQEAERSAPAAEESVIGDSFEEPAKSEAKNAVPGAEPEEEVPF
jgi:single-strand DNA-binding protein